MGAGVLGRVQFHGRIGLGDFEVNIWKDFPKPLICKWACESPREEHLEKPWLFSKHCPSTPHSYYSSISSAPWLDCICYLCGGGGGGNLFVLKWATQSSLLRKAVNWNDCTSRPHFKEQPEGSCWNLSPSCLCSASKPPVVSLPHRVEAHSSPTASPYPHWLASACSAPMQGPLCHSGVLAGHHLPRFFYSSSGLNPCFHKSTNPLFPLTSFNKNQTFPESIFLTTNYTTTS